MLRKSVDRLNEGLQNFPKQISKIVRKKTCQTDEGLRNDCECGADNKDKVNNRSVIKITESREFGKSRLQKD